MPDLIGSVGGQVKSEVSDRRGNPLRIRRIICLRSKVYIYEAEEPPFDPETGEPIPPHIDLRSKGTTKAAQERDLTWDAYVEALRTKKCKQSRNAVFRRKGFNVSLEQVDKISLNNSDGKREECCDGIHTLAWGYH